MAVFSLHLPRSSCFWGLLDGSLPPRSEALRRRDACTALRACPPDNGHIIRRRCLYASQFPKFWSYQWDPGKLFFTSRSHFPPETNYVLWNHRLFGILRRSCGCLAKSVSSPQAKCSHPGCGVKGRYPFGKGDERRKTSPRQQARGCSAPAFRSQVVVRIKCVRICV